MMKKYIFLMLVAVCLFSCKDDEKVRQTKSPEVAFTTDKEEYTLGDIVYLTDESVETEGQIAEYFCISDLMVKEIGLRPKTRPSCIRKQGLMSLN